MNVRADAPMSQRCRGSYAFGVIKKEQLLQQVVAQLAGPGVLDVEINGRLCGDERMCVFVCLWIGDTGYVRGGAP